MAAFDQYMKRIGSNQAWAPGCDEDAKFWTSLPSFISHLQHALHPCYGCGEIPCFPIVVDAPFDLIWGDHSAIEIKATKKVTPRDLRGLKALVEEQRFNNYLLVSQDPIARRVEGIRCLPWQTLERAPLRVSTASAVEVGE